MRTLNGTWILFCFLVLVISFAGVDAVAQSETLRASVSSGGVEANAASSYHALSENGQYVAFESEADNLVAGDTNGESDIFVHDTQTRETWCVSVSSTGVQGNDVSGAPSITPDGRYVAFHSNADNLVSGDSNGTYDVFVHDSLTGLTTLVSKDAYGGPANGGSSNPSISADGRYVAFISSAVDLVSGDTNGFPDIFVRDLQIEETVRVNVDSSGEQSNDYCYDPSMAPDGQAVAFSSYATNLVPDDDNWKEDIFVHIMTTGQTVRASVSSLGVECDDHCEYPFMASGGIVAFQSKADNLVVGDTKGWIDIFVHDVFSGETVRINLDPSGGQIHGDSYYPSLSETGGVVNFDIEAGMVNAGRNYLLLGGVTPKGLGVFLPGWLTILPVEWDPFTDFVFLYLNSPIFADFLGTLDGNGESTAQINAPALGPGFTGVRMYYAFRLNSPFDYVSNVEVVEIVP